MRSLLLLTLALSWPAIPAEAKPGERVDDVPRIALISAFEPEWIALGAAVTDARERRINGVRFISGKIGGRPVLLFLSGVSMVNAAMTTQLAVDRFNIRSIVFSGVAGGLDPTLDVGDVVVPERWGQYLESVFARAQGEGFEPPPSRLTSEPIANYGMIFPVPVSVHRDGAEQAERRFWFDADPGLLAVARRVAAQTSLARCQQDLCFRVQPKVVVGGQGISAPVFMDNSQFRAYAFTTFKAQVTDMETAAVAQVAYANRLPYIAFRSLSDLAGGDPGENQARAFYRISSNNAAAVVVRFIAAMDMPAD